MTNDLNDQLALEKRKTKGLGENADRYKNQRDALATELDVICEQRQKLAEYAEKWEEKQSDLSDENYRLKEEIRALNEKVSRAVVSATQLKEGVSNLVDEVEMPHLMPA